MITENGDNLVFLLSTPRSGSTLLTSILGGSDNIHCPPEYWLLLPLYAIRDPNVLMVANYDQELARQAWNNLITKDQFNNASRNFALTVYNQHLQDVGKTILIDKTPRYYHILDWIDHLFPKAKKIWLKRNPLDVISSTITSWHIYIQEIVGERLSPHSFDYTISQLNYLEYFSNLSEYKHVVKYEDFVQDPRTEIENVCAFLDVKFDDQILEYRKQNPKLLEALSGDLAMGDRTILNHSSTHSESIGKWKSGLSIPETRSILWGLGSKLFKDLDYYEEFIEATRYAKLNPAKISEHGRLKEILNFYNTSYTEGRLYYENVMYTKVARENVRLRNLLWNTQETKSTKYTFNQLLSRFRNKLRNLL